MDAWHTVIVQPFAVSWLSNDPIGIAGGFNQYVAFGNNPVMFVDPWGLQTGWQDIRRIHNEGTSTFGVSVALVLGRGVHIEITARGIAVKPARGFGGGIALTGERGVSPSISEGHRSIEMGFGITGGSLTMGGLDGMGPIEGYGGGLGRPFPIPFLDRLWVGVWDTREGSGYGRRWTWFWRRQNDDDTSGMHSTEKTDCL